MRVFPASISEVVDRFRDDPDMHAALDHWAERRIQSSNPQAVDQELIERFVYLLGWHATNPVEDDGEESA